MATKTAMQELKDKLMESGCLADWMDDAFDEAIEKEKYTSLKTKELEAEIERLKGLIEKLYKSTGNRIMANMFDDNIDITWQQFKTEHNL